MSYPGLNPPPYPDLAWENKQGTQPFPPRGTAPVPGWFGSESVLSWTEQAIPAGGATICRRAVWTSPVFDLQPQFLGSVGDDARTRGTQAIFPGTAGTLRVQVFAQAGIGTMSGVSVAALHAGHVKEVQKLRILVGETDHTAVLTAGSVAAGSIPAPWAGLNDGTSGLLTLTAPGGGAPLRYWQVMLLFRQYAPAPPTVPEAPRITIAAGYY